MFHIHKNLLSSSFKQCAIFLSRGELGYWSKDTYRHNRDKAIPGETNYCFHVLDGCVTFIILLQVFIFIFYFLLYSFKSSSLYSMHSFNLCVSFSLTKINSSMHSRSLFLKVLHILRDSCFTSTFLQLSFEIS